jgi:hypothetical protein
MALFHPASAQLTLPTGSACNAGNAGVERALARGPVLLGEALHAMTTRYSGEGGIEMRTMVVRIEGGRVRSHEIFTGHRLHAGQRLAAHELPGPGRSSAGPGRRMST